uniref:Serine recombinase, PinQ/PinR-type n=1 Tax=Klebsiella pneumoniae TaxID=573 RepID=A0A8B0SW06_KLEPN|nr:Serine recombinase, PinQ/PinR-type [Klebsiella pneumoniae]
MVRLLPVSGSDLPVCSTEWKNGDVLIVTKLDRLGRNAMDVRKTVEQLAASGIRVHCLALGGVDLTSAAGRMTMQVISAVAEFEKDLLIERTHSGIARAVGFGKTLRASFVTQWGTAAGGAGTS